MIKTSGGWGEKDLAASVCKRKLVLRKRIKTLLE